MSHVLLHPSLTLTSSTQDTPRGKRGGSTISRARSR